VSARKAYEPTPSGRQPTTKGNYDRNNKSRNLKAGRTILVGLALATVSLVSAAVGAILAVNFSTASPLQQAELSSEEQKVFSQEETVAAKSLNLPELSRPVNILVLGIKVIRSDLEKEGKSVDSKNLGYDYLVNSFEGLSDTMLVLRFDPQQEKLAVLSIPRDTRVYLEGYGVRKINHANKFGGPALTAAAASELLGGINIDRYVRLNVQGVEKLIDALGGVTVNVPKDMKYNDFSQHLYINLHKGEQHLDGDKAMQFLRFRYDGLGDISRVQRQQMLMRSTVEQTLKPATIVKIPKLLSVIQSHIDTNLTVKELMALSNFASKTKRSNVQMLMLPGDFNDPSEGVSYWLPDDRRINKLMAQHFNLPTNEDDYQLGDAQYASLEDNSHTSAAKLRISVQDSTGKQETLQSALDTLRESGYGRVSASENWQDPLAKTRIIAQSGDQESAEAVRAILGVGEIVVESTGVLNSDITIQIGRDWKKQVNANSEIESGDNFNNF
jgi:polyisoprenyl-teichoic acid--peptidoglycan teichoic acid transferase